MRKCKTPPAAKISDVKPGCYVKKCFPGGLIRRGPHAGVRAARECMWIKVKRVTANGYEGTLANKPIAAKGLRYGQRVRVRRDQVVQATCRMP